VEAFAGAGADGVALPAPGTVPGMTLEMGRSLIELARLRGLVVMNAMGTSQEGTSIRAIEQLALMSKMTGADVHHLGDSGYRASPSPRASPPSPLPSVDAATPGTVWRPPPCARIRDCNRKPTLFGDSGAPALLTGSCGNAPQALGVVSVRALEVTHGHCSQCHATPPGGRRSSA